MSGKLFVVDTGPINLVAKFVDETKLPAGLLMVAEEVRDELLRSKTHPDYAARYRLMTSPAVTVRPITLEEAEASIVLLRKVKVVKFDEGEAQSVAVCMLEAERSFVTQDKHALFVACAELGPERCCLSFDLWSFMQSQGLIDDVVCTTLMTASRNSLRDAIGPVTRFSKFLRK